MRIQSACLCLTAFLSVRGGRRRRGKRRKSSLSCLLPPTTSSLFSLSVQCWSPYFYFLSFFLLVIILISFSCHFSISQPPHYSSLSLSQSPPPLPLFVFFSLRLAAVLVLSRFSRTIPSLSLSLPLSLSLTLSYYLVKSFCLCDSTTLHYTTLLNVCMSSIRRPSPSSFVSPMNHWTLGSSLLLLSLSLFLFSSHLIMFDASLIRRHKTKEEEEEEEWSTPSTSSSSSSLLSPLSLSFFHTSSKGVPNFVMKCRVQWASSFSPYIFLSWYPVHLVAKRVRILTRATTATKKREIE